MRYAEVREWYLPEVCAAAAATLPAMAARLRQGGWCRCVAYVRHDGSDDLERPVPESAERRSTGCILHTAYSLDYLRKNIAGRETREAVAHALSVAIEREVGHPMHPREYNDYVANSRSDILRLLAAARELLCDG